MSVNLLMHNKRQNNEKCSLKYQLKKQEMKYSLFLKDKYDIIRINRFANKYH